MHQNNNHNPPYFSFHSQSKSQLHSLGGFLLLKKNFLSSVLLKAKEICGEMLIEPTPEFHSVLKASFVQTNLSG